MKRRLLPQTPVRRVLAALVAATTVTLGTAGCMVFSPVQTDVPYAPADGIQTNLGSVAIRDLVLVTNGSGEAMVSGGLVNQSAQAVTLQFAPQLEGGSTSGTEIQLQPSERVNLAEQGLQLTGVAAKPGRVIPVQVTSSTAGTTLLNVPVMAAEGYYATVTPTAVPTS
ncbi:MAG: hypothetical protein L0H79_16365 [Intrasporangium sp.]|uniref:hypothetical protein n=1 Tax=Intrasporangium sp. TaxID=1925024 RepID=UPI00264979E7|nr:hypothetical protein [Intrasporangium sp.]MDN5797312.1 hypothetical protein [Intrasporangium sp.]